MTFPRDWKTDVTKLDCDGYLVRYRPDVFVVDDSDRAYVVEFEAYKILAPYWTDDAGRHDEIMMERVGATCALDNPTTDFDEAQCFLRGSIKWDGCSNWGFVDSGCMIHFCGPEGPAEVARLFEKMYEIAGSIMGDHEWRSEDAAK